MNKLLQSLADLFPPIFAPEDDGEAGGDFSVTLSVNGKEFKATGENVIDVFRSLSEDKHIPKTKMIITLEQGDKRSTKMLYIVQTRRFLMNDATRQVIAKQMEITLK